MNCERGQLLAAEIDLSAPEVTSLAELETVLAYQAGSIAEVLVPRGDYADAEAYVARVHLAWVHPGHQIYFLRGRGRLYLETGRAERALDDFRAVGQIAESLGIENPASARGGRRRRSRCIA